MHDVLIPVQASDIELLDECVEALVRDTDVPIRVVVILDGATPDEAAAVSDSFSEGDIPWQVLFNVQPVGLNQSIREALQDIHSTFFTLVSPAVRISDRQWFGKMQQIFSKDPICGIVDTMPETKSTTMHPIRRQHNRPAQGGCRFAMLQTRFAKLTQPIGKVDPVEHWSRSALSGGGTAWHMQAVNYSLIETQEHQLCPARSVPQSQFE